MDLVNSFLSLKIKSRQKRITKVYVPVPFPKILVSAIKLVNNNDPCLSPCFLKTVAFAMENWPVLVALRLHIKTVAAGKQQNCSWVVMLVSREVDMGGPCKAPWKKSHSWISGSGHLIHFGKYPSPHSPEVPVFYFIGSGFGTTIAQASVPFLGSLL